MKVYKVVFLYNEEEGMYRSAIIADEEFDLLYKVGEPTHPPMSFPKAKLFAFRELDDAKKFLGGLSSNLRTIFLAEAKPARNHRRFIPCHIVNRTVKRYWNNDHFNFLDVTPIPEGTILCDEITLLEKVTL